MIYCRQDANGNQPQYGGEKQFVDPNYGFNQKAIFITEPEKGPNSQA